MYVSKARAPPVGCTSAANDCHMKRWKLQLSAPPTSAGNDEDVSHDASNSQTLVGAPESAAAPARGSTVVGSAGGAPRSHPSIHALDAQPTAASQPRRLIVSPIQR